MANSGRGSNDLSVPHWTMLEKGSGISPELIEARGYRTVNNIAELRRHGFTENQSRVPALLIPLWGVSGQIVGYQARPDQPRIDPKGKAIKYETPRGMLMVLDIHPSMRARAGDPSEPLWISEGVKKADALASRGCCAIALLGVWAWRGTNEQGGKTALPDWETVALNNRKVFLVFDSDVMEKHEVNSALTRLKRFLESRGAAVRLVYLPKVVAGAKMGVDDHLVAGHSVADLEKLSCADLRPIASSGEPEPPYGFTPSGLVWMKPTQDGSVSIPLANFNARIVAQVVVDDGAESSRLLELEAEQYGRPFRFTLPAQTFTAMNWPVEHLGAGAILYPGFGLKDHARAAIQLLSGRPPIRRVFRHIGWREIDGHWVYLHGDGAICAVGHISDVLVQLESQVSRYILPPCPNQLELQAAIRASLGLLEVAPKRVTVPLLTAVYRAVLGDVDFSEHVTGPTGSGKTALAALGQQHFGPDMDARNLPGSWLSTGNALELGAFLAKDAVFVVDDFVPAGNISDIQRGNREADRLLRAQGNRAGRGRMRPDGTLRPAKPPRGLIISTGEDSPRGQSLRARTFTLELGPSDIDWKRLTVCQADAGAGRYAQTVAGFIQWIAPQYEEIRRRRRDEVALLRAQATTSGVHPRLPGIIGDLAFGFRLFLEFACQAAALSAEEARQLWSVAWKSLLEASAAQVEHQAGGEPTQRFIELLSACIASGRAHIAALDGKPPTNPESWGWRASTIGSGPSEPIDWRPQGARVGWVNGDDLYLEPEAAYGAAQKLGEDVGDSIPVQSKTLHRRLSEKGLLKSSEQSRNRLTIRQTLEKGRRAVLHMAASIFQGTSQSSQPARPGPDHEGIPDWRPPGGGPILRADYDALPRKTAPSGGVAQQAMNLEGTDGGPFGPLGTQTGVETEVDARTQHEWRLGPQPGGGKS